MRNRHLLASVAALLFVSYSPVCAATFTYAQGRRQIRACSLLLPGVDGPETVDGKLAPSYPGIAANSGLFVRLNTSVFKPAGWEFVNPLAPPVVTPQISARYSGNLPLGARVNKTMAAYWDVKLSEATLSRLLQFDVVYLALPPGIAPLLDAEKRNMLAKLVDSGAQLWIDWGGGGSVTFGNPLVGQGLMIPDPALGFASGGTPAAQGLMGHPLLRYPYRIGQQELDALGAQAGSVTVGPAGAAILAPVVDNSGGGSGPQIVAGAYGAGHLIMSARNIGAVLSAANPPQVPFIAAAKFAYNLVSWGGNYPTTYGSAGHASWARQGPDAGLQTRWSAALPVAPGSSPVVSGGVVYVSGADGALYAFDATPEQDLDGNGNPDDGSDTSYRVGSGADLLWKSSIGGVLSGPTVCSWPGGPPVGAPGTDVVLVANDAGKVFVVAAWPDPTGKTAPLPLSVPPYQGWAVPSPTYHNGIICVTGGGPVGGDRQADAYLWANLYCYDPVAGQQWRVPDPVNRTDLKLEPRVCAPTVGWTADTSGGAMDLMAYWVTGRHPDGSDPTNDRLVAALISVRGEPLNGISGDIAATRYSGQRSFAQKPGQPDTGYHLWTVDPQTGTPRDLTPQVNTSTFPPAGQWSFKPGQVNTTWPIFADYRAARDTTDLGNPALAGFQDFLYRDIYSPTPQPQVNATMPQLTVNPWKTDNLAATPAMGTDGTLYIVGDRQVPGGTASQISAVRDVGPRNQQLDEKPYPRQFLDWTAVLASVPDRIDGTTYYPATDFTPDTDSVSGNGTGEEPLDAFQITGPPAVTDDAVYVTAVGRGASGPAIALFAFERKPKFQIKLNSSVDFFDAEGKHLPVRLWQGNPFAAELTVPPLMEAVGIGGGPIDFARKTITFSNFEDASLMISGRPIVAGAPVHVFIGPTEVGSDKFTNLRWYFIPYLGTQRVTGPVSPPTVIGNYVYFGAGAGSDGYVFSVRKDANPSRDKQVFGVPPLAGGEASKDVPDPIHVPNSGALSNPIAGAGGMVVVSSNGGLSVLDSGSTLIADSARLIEVSGSGAAVWSMESVDSGGQSTSLSRPTVARIVDPLDMVSPVTGGGEMIICDSGNNRVLRATRGGQVLGEIRTFEDPLGLLTAGEPRTLANPRDVRFWELIEPDPIDPAHPAVRVEHFLVADRDNFRVLDLIVRYDGAGTVIPAGAGGNPVALNWVSASRSGGRMLRYETAQPFQTSPGVWDILSAVSNYTVTDQPGSDEQGGGIVRLAYFTNPAPPAREYKHPGIISGFAPNIKNGAAQQRLVNPRFFERTWIAANDFVDLVCDNAGVWMLDSAANVLWGLRSDEYKNALGQAAGAGVVVNRGVPLRASSAKLLPNGNILISNSYTGTNVCGLPFSGEVFEVNRSAAPQQIVWCAPSIATVVPCGTGFSFTQQIARSYLIEQPSFADRR